MVIMLKNASNPLVKQQLTANALQNHQKLMTVLFIEFIVVLLIAVMGYGTISPLLVFALILSSVTLLILFVFVSYIKANLHKTKLELLHIYLMVSHFVLGFCLTIITYIINLKLAFILVLLLMVSHLACLLLSHRFAYLVVFVIASMVGVFIKLFTALYGNTVTNITLYQTNYVDNLILIFIYALIVLYAGKKIIEKYNHHLLLSFRYKQLNQDFEQQQTLTQESEIAYLQQEQAMRQLHQDYEAKTHFFQKQIKEYDKSIQQYDYKLKQYAQRLDFAQHISGIATWDWNLQSRQLITNNMMHITGYSDATIQKHASNIQTFIHPDDYGRATKTLFRHIRGKSDQFKVSYRFFHANGEWRWLLDTGKIIEYDDKGKPLRIVGIRRDISQEINNAENLRLASRVFLQSDEGIFILNNNREYVSVNPSFERITGFSLTELKEKDLFIVPVETLPQEYCDQAVIVLEELENYHEFSGELRFLHKDKKPITLNIHINALYDNGKITHYIGFVLDITEQQRNQEQLSYLANYDALTSLPNRLYFKSQLHDAMMRTSKEIVVIRVNIDRFRFINDSIGNTAADELLKKIAIRIRDLNHPHVKLIARMGSDDFAIFLELKNSKDVQGYLDKLIQSVDYPLVIYEHELYVKLSIGVSVYPLHARQVDGLINRAEQALQQAKRNGGDNICWYSQDLKVYSLANLQLESELRSAINHNELKIYYQPKVNLNDYQIIGFEALVRWEHPNKGLLTPDRFMSTIVESGLSAELNQLVIQQVCTQIKQWGNLATKDITIAFNTDATQIQQGDLGNVIKHQVNLSGINPQQLQLELTETSLINPSSYSKQQLFAIKKLGLTIALDDFGTGYSSLSYLSEYPIDVLKIDRSFIDDITDNDTNIAIVRTIIAMGKALGMKIVAEGIETLAQAHLLKSEGCHYGQGFYFGKAMTANQATTLLENYLNIQQQEFSA